MHSGRERKSAQISKSPMSVIFPSAILGREMAGPPGIFWLFLLENPTPIKFLVLGGGGVFGFFWKGGVEVPVLDLLGGAEMTIILSDNNSRIFTAPCPTPWRVEAGEIVQNYCHCISWEKATTIKLRFSKMLFFLCCSPTIKFQDGSPVDPLFEPPADPPFWLDLSKIIFIVISASLIYGRRDFSDQSFSERSFFVEVRAVYPCHYDCFSPGFGGPDRSFWPDVRTYSGPVRDNSPYRAILFRDSIAEGGIAPVALFS